MNNEHFMCSITYGYTGGNLNGVRMELHWTTNIGRGVYRDNGNALSKTKYHPSTSYPSVFQRQLLSILIVWKLRK